jgi:hypothetical protein
MIKNMKKNILAFIVIAILFSCSSDSSSIEQAFSEAGKGGSLARFVLKDNYLYTVDIYGLNVFNVNNPEMPVKVNNIPISFNIETIFNLKEYLYIGSQNGMFIYDISTPESPTYVSDVQHFTACDPVVANLTHAFVTLHADVGCGNNINVLETYDITDITNPFLVSSRNLTRPIGMGLYQNYLFVCDDEVKIFDITNPENMVLVHAIEKNAFDVIIYDNLMVLIGENGLYQYSLDESNIQNTVELSSIDI